MALPNGTETTVQVQFAIASPLASLALAATLASGVVGTSTPMLKVRVAGTMTTGALLVTVTVVVPVVVSSPSPHVRTTSQSPSSAPARPVGKAAVSVWGAPG